MDVRVAAPRPVPASVVLLLMVVAMCVGAVSFAHSAPKAPRLRLYAAASLMDVASVLAEAFDRGGVDVSFGGSSALARQIRDGAPADVFLSASPDWVEFLEEAGATTGAPLVLARNRLVCIARRTAGGLGREGTGDSEAGPRDTRSATAGSSSAPPRASEASEASEASGSSESSESSESSGSEGTSGVQDTRAFLQQLLHRLGAHGGVAIADDGVPAGEYARRALQTLDLLAAFEPHLVGQPNVRAVLHAVERGELDAGFVYETDANVAEVEVLGTLDPSLHPPIEYRAVVVRNAPNGDAARRFLEYLRSEPARKTLSDAGFTLP